MNLTYMVCKCQVADRLPFTGETLVSSKIGKIVRKLAKDAPIPGEYSLLFVIQRSLSCGTKVFLFMMASHTPIVMPGCTLLFANALQ
jgi:hypothetical protein